MSNWQDAVIGFGKNKGVRLGDLNPKQLQWYHENVSGKPYTGKDGQQHPASQQDIRLRQALNEWSNSQLGPEEPSQVQHVSRPPQNRPAIAPRATSSLPAVPMGPYTLDELYSLWEAIGGRIKFNPDCDTADSYQAAKATIFIAATKFNLKAPVEPF